MSKNIKHDLYNNNNDDNNASRCSNAHGSTLFLFRTPQQGAITVLQVGACSEAEAARIFLASLPQSRGQVRAHLSPRISLLQSKACRPSEINSFRSPDFSYISPDCLLSSSR